MKLYSSRRGFPHRVHCRRTVAVINANAEPAARIVILAVLERNIILDSSQRYARRAYRRAYYYGAPYYYGAYYGVPYYRRYDAPYSMGVRILSNSVFWRQR